MVSVNTGDNAAAAAAALSSNPADLGCQVSKEIEDEANSYFQRIYNHPPHPTLSIDEILDLLKKFQDSPLKRERVRFWLSERRNEKGRFFSNVVFICRKYTAV